MADANPPLPLAPGTPGDVITKGTVLHYGLDDIAITGIIIDSYKRDQQYADVQEVTNQAGKVVGVRMSDFRANVSVDGRVLLSTPYTVKIGDKLTINGDDVLIESVSYSGQAKGFHNLSISGKAYEQLAGHTAYGV